METQVRGILATVGTPAATGTPTTPETIREARTYKMPILALTTESPATAEATGASQATTPTKTPATTGTPATAEIITEART